MDKALALDNEISSRNRAVFLIDSGFVKVNGKPCKASYHVKNQDQIHVMIPEEPTDVLSPLDLKLDILFEDQDVIVVNKPAGLVVHPAAGHEQDTLVNALVNHTQDLSMKFGEKRPGIVHRLDRDTSGVLVVAKNDLAHEALVQQFKHRTVHRIYEAVVIGNLSKASGRVESYLARHPTNRKSFASLLDKNKKTLGKQPTDPEVGKWSITNYKLITGTPSLSLVELKLETGRTHQIRVHLSELGHPIFADNLYGADRKAKSLPLKLRELQKQMNRFLLHACRLEFDHPRTGERLKFYAEWPTDCRQLLKELGLK